MPIPHEDSYSQDQYPDGEHIGDEGLSTDSEEDGSLFVNLALLSHLAVRLRDRVPRGLTSKGAFRIPGLSQERILW